MNKYNHKQFAKLVIGMNEEEFKKVTGIKISNQTLGKWSQGITAPNAKQLISIANGFNTPDKVNYFYKGE